MSVKDSTKCTATSTAAELEFVAAGQPGGVVLPGHYPSPALVLTYLVLPYLVLLRVLQLSYHPSTSLVLP